MRNGILAIVTTVFLGLASEAPAAVISFNSDPFAGSDALTTPGRQVVGGELFLPSFDFASDVFVFDAKFFDVSGIAFVNDVIENVPASGVNTIALRTFDNDNDPGTAFGAGTAANLLAAQITTPGAGFFIYFNQGLDLPRLVYSTDLDDPTADLKILARFSSLTGAGGQNQMALFSADNFEVRGVPEPASLVLIALGGAWPAWRRFARRRARA
jgi:hypothetical protein